MPFSLSDGDVLREEDSIKSFGERSTLNFPLIPLSRPLVFIINSLSVESNSRSSFAGDDAADDEWLFFLSLAGAFNSISCIHWSTTEKDIEKEKFNLFELVMDFYEASSSQPPWLDTSFPSRLYLQLREKPLRKYERETSTRGGWNEVSFQISTATIARRDDDAMMILSTCWCLHRAAFRFEILLCLHYSLVENIQQG